jgi:hypothetical protein
LATDQKAFDKVGSDISAERAKLAVTTVPADANALITQITQMIIAQRGLQGVVLDDQDRLADLQASLDSAAATLARASARVANAQASIATALAEASKRDMYRGTSTGDFERGQCRFSGQRHGYPCDDPFGEKLSRQTPGDRGQTARYPRQPLEEPAHRSCQLLRRTRPLAGNGQRPGRRRLPEATAFQRAQNTLANYVATAANSYTKAKAVMAALKAIELDASGTVPDVLTAAEKAQLTALTTAGATAEGTAETLDADLNGVFTAEAALQSQILA